MFCFTATSLQRDHFSSYLKKKKKKRGGEKKQPQKYFFGVGIPNKKGEIDSLQSPQCLSTISFHIYVTE